MTYDVSEVSTDRYCHGCSTDAERSGDYSTGKIYRYTGENDATDGSIIFEEDLDDYGTGWKCGNCDTVNDDDDDTSHSGYVCEGCDELHEEPLDAIACCNTICSGNPDTISMCDCAGLNFGNAIRGNRIFQILTSDGEETGVFLCIWCHCWMYEVSADSHLQWCNERDDNESMEFLTDIRDNSSDGPACSAARDGIREILDRGSSESESDESESRRAYIDRAPLDGFVVCHLCQGDICCLKHNHHKTPHKGCLLS